MALRQNKQQKFNAVRSIAWLAEAAFRASVGWILLTNFDQMIVVGLALYALGTAGVIVVMHFFNAHK